MGHYDAITEMRQMAVVITTVVLPISQNEKRKSRIERSVSTG